MIRLRHVLSFRVWCSIYGWAGKASDQRARSIRRQIHTTARPLYQASHQGLRHLLQLTWRQHVPVTIRRATSARQPCWMPYDCTLAQAATPSQRQMDTDAQPSTPHLIASDFLCRPTTRGEGGGAVASSSLTHMIVLNWALPACLVELWHQASIRICADGGANRLYDQLPYFLPNEPPDDVRERFLPDVIHGDLDSLRPDVRGFYMQHGVPVVFSSDQDSTDLTKCVSYSVQWHRRWVAQARGSVPAVVAGRPGGGVGSHGEAAALRPPSLPPHGQDFELLTATAGPEPHLDAILVAGALGGRLDHTLANLNSLHMFRHLPLVLLGEGNVVRLVRAGTTRIRPCLEAEGPICGLVPIAGPATVTTRGLKWDLEDGVMEMGGLVSTSNQLMASEVVVQSDRDLIWTTALKA